MDISQEKLEQRRDEFSQHGLTVSSWADANGFSRVDVYAVLSGRSKCVRGKAHLIAVALGLKSQKVSATPN